LNNVFLDAGTTRDIDKRVDVLLRDIGNPEGRVDLALIRDRLKLDLHYYSSQDDGLLKEVIHKLTVGAKQVLLRPALLGEAIKTFDLRALFLPDRRRILLDAAMPDLKKRWGEGHESVHSILPWHADYLLGDTRNTLSPACHERIEAEANYGTGRLLFPPRVFREFAYSAAPNMDQIKQIAARFGNTITSSLWRYVENDDGIVFGLVGQHPHYQQPGEERVAYFIRSLRFTERFANVSAEHLFEFMKGYCTHRRAGPVGYSEVLLEDANRVRHIFHMETFGIKYHVLTLARHVRIKETLVAGV
jgi:hypothetical protein